MSSTRKAEKSTKQSAGRKRKKSTTSASQQLQEERLERYNKLVYMATKAFHKEAKVVKSFTSRRIVRRLKNKQSHISAIDEQQLADCKRLSLDTLTHVCLQRLGIFNLNPQPSKERQQQQQQATTLSTLSKETVELIERLLKHKRLVSAMETWNAKITDYRKWYLQRVERLSNVPDFATTGTTTKSSHPHGRKRNKKRQGATTIVDRDGGGGASEMFVCLGGGTAPSMEGDDSSEPMAYYGPSAAFTTGDMNEDYAVPVVAKRKNRPGQRARKAKAMAVQAKREGRAVVSGDQSFNWREKKQRPHPKGGRDDSHGRHKADDDAPTPATAADIATMGKTWKEEGKEHPSWAARQSQMTGIVAFAGKKITFD